MKRAFATSAIPVYTCLTIMGFFMALSVLLSPFKRGIIALLLVASLGALLPCCVFATDSTGETGNEHLALNNLEITDLRYLVDPSRDLTPAQVLLRWSSMQKLSFTTVNMGFKREAYWFAFRLPNNSNGDKKVYLDTGYPLLDSISLSLYDEQGKLLKVYQSGDTTPFHNRPINTATFVFPLTLLPKTEHRVVIGIDTRSSTKLDLELSSAESFVLSSQESSLIFGLTLGVLVVMALYNILIFFSLKDWSYLYLSVTFSCFAFFQVSISGRGFQYLWPESPGWNNVSLPFSAFATLCAYLLFMEDFLKIKQTLPKLLPVTRFLTAACGAFALFSVFIDYQFLVKGAIAALFFCFAMSFVAGGVLFQRGYKPARYFLLAFAALIVGTSLWALSVVGLAERTMLTGYFATFGVICCVSLLSLSLADRINSERSAKESAEQNALENLDKYREVYENTLEGMFRLDHELHLKSCNPAFAELIGHCNENELLEEISSLYRLVPAEEESRQMILDLLVKQGHVFGFEAKCRRLDGSEFWGAIFVRQLSGPDGMYIEGSILNITDRKESENRLDYLACNDPLTGLLNRQGIELRILAAIDSSIEGQAQHALLYMDLDQFKIVNDTCGHSAGDKLLEEIAAMIKSRLRDHDHIARLGGDEFMILLEKCPIDRASEIANAIKSDIQDFRFTVNDRTFSCSTSIGLVPITENTRDLEHIISLADTACHAAKDAGRNRVVSHDEANGEVAKRQEDMKIVNVLRNAIEKDDLVLFKQNIGAVKPDLTGERYEILLRLNDNGKLMPPGLFLPAAEQYNIISLVDRWVVETYFRWLHNNPKAQENLVQCNINLSGQTISDGEFESFLNRCLSEYQIPANKICFEITESSAVASFLDTADFLKTMKKRGFKFALDDFGSGYASYSYLKKLPVDSVKIDGAFVKEILHDNFDLTLVKSITDIAHSIDLLVVAEFVENQEIFDKLAGLGVDLAQGYGIHKPEPL